MMLRPLRFPLFPYTTLFRSQRGAGQASPNPMVGAVLVVGDQVVGEGFHVYPDVKHAEVIALEQAGARAQGATLFINLDRKSTRLNSSHPSISYAVFCLKKKM